MGGSITGEHGVGMEKNELMPLLFSADDLEMMGRIKGVFDPNGGLNPGKVFPTLSACVEQGHMHVKGGRLPFANLPRF